MIQKNAIVCAVTEGLGTNGEGIIRHEGITFFVPFCLPGEKVIFRVLKIKDKIGYGKVEEVLTPAEERVRTKCEVFQKCGGCQLQHLDYHGQLKFKNQVVKESLRKIAGIHTHVSSTVKSSSPFGYRNKLQIPVGVNRDGETVIGFYAERSHRIVPVTSCAIQPKWATGVIGALHRYMSECAVEGYDEEKKKGSVRHLVVREIDKKYIVTLVVTTEKLPNLRFFEDLLAEVLPEYTLWLNLNDKDTNVVFGDKFTLIRGRGFFDGLEQDIRFEAGPRTFIQVNENVRSKLYQEAVDSVVQDGDEVVIDAYSGGGLMTAMVAKRAKRVYGIELVPEAVRCADELKKKNNLQNMTNICGYVEEKLVGVLEKEKGEKVRLILDPPRAGIHRSVLMALLQSGIPKITMISCNPATMARDVGILTGHLREKDGELVKATAEELERDKGKYYEIISITPFDMFPQTKHVESVVCLTRRLDVDMRR